MKVDVMLYGHLRKFGRVFSVDIESPAEAMRFLLSQVKGFEAHMQRHLASGFRVILDGEDADEKRLQMPMFGVKTIKIVPLVKGAKSDGVQMLFGAVLLAAGVVYQIPMLTTMGASMMMGGVAQMLATNPSGAALAAATADRSGGKFFGGPTNTYGQGACVPVRYGKVRCGGHIISAGSAVETYANGANGGAFSGGDGLGGSTGDGVTTPLVYSIDPQ